jgi:hypothetical protein
MKSIFNVFSFSIICLLVVSCHKDDNNYIEDSEVIKRWSAHFTSGMVSPTVAGHADSGTFNMELHANNSITFDLYDSSLISGDALTGAFIRAGDPVTNGPIVLNLNPRISGRYLSGVIPNVRQSLVDSLLDNTNDLYFELQSSRVPTGVARAQLNLDVVAAFNVPLTGQEEVPPVITTATGNAYLRLTSNQVLYSNVTGANVEPNDVMNMAHIHKAPRGANGPIIVPLVASPAEFGVTRKTTVDQATFNSLLNDPIYVNAHSVLVPTGKIRGQIR